MHNRQTEIAVLAVFRLVACVAAVFTGTDKQTAECVPIVQKHSGLSVYQALGGTDAAVPPKQVSNSIYITPFVVLYGCRKKTPRFKHGVFFLTVRTCIRHRLSGCCFCSGCCLCARNCRRRSNLCPIPRGYQDLHSNGFAAYPKHRFCHEPDSHL